MGVGVGFVLQHFELDTTSHAAGDSQHRLVKANSGGTGSTSRSVTTMLPAAQQAPFTKPLDPDGPVRAVESENVMLFAADQHSRCCPDRINGTSFDVRSRQGHIMLAFHA